MKNHTSIKRPHMQFVYACYKKVTLKDVISSVDKKISLNNNIISCSILTYKRRINKMKTLASVTVVTKVI